MTIHDENPDDDAPRSLARQGADDKGEPLEMGVPGEGTTANPAADDGQMDSQDMPTTDGEMTEPDAESGWAEFQEKGTLEQ